MDEPAAADVIPAWPFDAKKTMSPGRRFVRATAGNAPRIECVE
jgi:hypothetical protein